MEVLILTFSQQANIPYIVCGYTALLELMSTNLRSVINIAVHFLYVQPILPGYHK